MDSLEPMNVLQRAVSMMVADPRSPLDREERAACLGWLQELPCDVVMLVPDDIADCLVPYIAKHMPSMLEELGHWVTVPIREIPKFLLIDSHLEIHFARTWEEEGLDLVYPLTPQYSYKGGKYYFDFAYPRFKVCIELDSYTYHSSREQFNKDRVRQREIEADGWRVIRFSGDEIRADSLRCVRETSHFLSVHGFRQQREGRA